ncbi:hypothetical protein B4O97_02120 [Marispirochaeta aestuarii]|uniref:Uncharacterized protein n=1 Tax=Marispirochaeta aestuarii TaxID=1963862 RepID=A0A1Y1S380_9SPIO|nr:hypothetical protein [Marispirochaeta aestuarii]ORC37821.1 hypothetical protein B4O97_02120 [Marispirochaeta aestuarii]
MPRNDHISAIVKPGHRFVWGLLLLLSFLFIQGLLPRFAMVILFALMARAAGKRIKFSYFIILTSSIALFNLLTPWGEVLYSPGGFDITRGALIAGLTKGITISGLVFVSLFSVSRDLKLPGRFGRLLGRSFYYFESLYSHKRKIHRRSFFSDIDGILLDLFPSENVPDGEDRFRRTTPLGVLVIMLSFGITGAIALWM